MSECTFNGFDVVRPNPEVYARLDRFWDENAPDLWVFPGYLTARTDHLPIPYPPAHRRAPFNTLVWPRGASRWAEFHCLMEGAAVAALQTSLSGSGCPTMPGTLLLSDDNTGFSVSPTMYVIGARPVYLSPDGKPAANRAGQLYWVTLVDNRFFWWTQKPFFSFTAGDSWTTLLTNLLAAATPTSATIPGIPGAYGNPSPIRWGQAGVPLPLLIDAAAATVGLRFVIQTNGTAAFVTAAGAASADLTQFNTIGGYRAPSYGGRITVSEIIGGIPAGIMVGFWGDAIRFIQVLLSDLALPAYGGCTGVSNSFAWIQSDQNAAMSSPTPSSAATQYATDYYGWRLSLTDATWAGVFNLQLTGLEDRIEWEWAGRREVMRDDDSPKNPLVDGELPGVRILSRIVRGDFGDTNLYGDRAPPGYTYQCVLTSQVSGTGPGSIWAANIRVVNTAGNIVDGPPLGFATTGGGGVLYQDRLSAGVAGTAALGDHVTAVPDPLTPYIWTFVPGVSGDINAGCTGCAWLLNVGTSSCLTGTVVGADGMCSCIQVGQSFPLVYQSGFWKGGMLKTCCGCAIVSFAPSGGGVLTASMTFTDNNSCQTGSSYSYTMSFGGCCGGNTAVFAGSGPDNCSGVPDPNCNNSFAIQITCSGGIPDLNCDCIACCNQAASGSLIVNIGGAWTGFSGTYIVTYQGNCIWSLDCRTGSGSGSGSGGGDIAILITNVGGTPAQWQLTVGGAVYTATAGWTGGGFSCVGGGTFNKVSGPAAAPSTITTSALFCTPNGATQCNGALTTVTATITDQTGNCVCETSIVLTIGGGGGSPSWGSAPKCENLQITLGLVCNFDGTYTLSVAGGGVPPFSSSTVSTTVQNKPLMILFTGVSLGAGTPHNCSGTCNVVITA